MKVIRSEKVFTGEKIENDLYIGIEDGIIKYVGKKLPDRSIVSVEEVRFLSPMFLDIHTHGAIGIDTNSATADDFLKLAEYNESCSLSAFMPTAVTDSYDNIIRILDNVRSAMEMQKSRKKGATILGLFIEGIFINPNKKGSHNEKYIRKIDLDFIDEISKKYKGVLRRIIIAPELENSKTAIKMLCDRGVKVGIGHSEANYDESIEAIENGADCAVHTFNAMGGFNHRKSGILLASLLENIYTELICDLVHTDRNAVRLLAKCKDKNKIILVSDNVCAKGTKGSLCKLGDVDVFIKDGRAITKDGCLAGGNSDIIRQIKNMTDIGIDEVTAFRSGCTNPAEYLGEDNIFGKIKVGNTAKFYTEQEEY